MYTCYTRCAGCLCTSSGWFKHVEKAHELCCEIKFHCTLSEREREREGERGREREREGERGREREREGERGREREREGERGREREREGERGRERERERKIK